MCRYEGEFPDGGIEIFAIVEENSVPQIRRLWHQNGTIWGVKANPEYVAYIQQEIPYDFAAGPVSYRHALYIWDLKEETRLVFELKPKLFQDHDFGCNYNITFTDKHMYSSFSFMPRNKIKDVLLVVDLHSGESTHSISKEADCDKDYDEDGGFDDVIKISGGKIRIQTNVWPDVSRILLSELTSGDAEKVIGRQRAINPKYAEKETSDNKMSSVQVDDFTEVKPGLCLFEAYDPSSANYEFVLETVAWPGEKLPRALKTWSEWFLDD